MILLWQAIKGKLKITDFTISREEEQPLQFYKRQGSVELPEIYIAGSLVSGK
jgi:hypothetical protein